MGGAAAEELRHDAPDARAYTWQTKALSLASTAVILYIFFATLFCFALIWTAFLSCFGPYRVRAHSQHLDRVAVNVLLGRLCTPNQPGLGQLLYRYAVRWFGLSVFKSTTPLCWCII